MLRSLAGFGRTPAYSAGGVGSQTVRAGGRLPAGVLLLVVACAASVSCAAAARPCRPPEACPRGHECLADRCLPLGAEPVDASSRRVVLTPVAIAVVHAAAGTQRALPPSVTFGGPVVRSEQLLLKFPVAFGQVDIDTAFLLLEAVPEAEPSPADVALEVTLAASEWASGTIDAAPSSRGPRAAGVGRTRPPAPLRVDVTAHVRELARHPESQHGLLIRATRPSPRGAVYSTGVDGPPPRLDVYVRPRLSSR